ncbi:MAG: hypothetical protein J0M00_09425 [Burkholderiales bacterium]|nr:hypothetical protein [Burkholderiales bacterium]
MNKAWGAAAMAVTVVLAGCASGPPFIDQAQPEALAIAQRRAAFEFNCPNVSTQVLSRETLQPISFRFGIERAEYTIGATGCGKRATYVVICPDQPGSTCFAAAGRDGMP